jgi:membrane-associated phospholipid phosphatase
MRAAICCAWMLGASLPALAQTATDRPLDVQPVAVEPARLDDLGFPQLVRDTFRDFGRLPSTGTLAWLGVGGTAAAFAYSADRKVSERWASSEYLDELSEPGHAIGGAPVQFGSALVLYIVGRATNRYKAARVGADLIQAQAVAAVLTTAVKVAVQRTRPDGAPLSFPSGHTSVSFASSTILHRHFGWKVGVPAYGLATLVAVSRIQTKRHYPSDVVFGATLGVLSARTVTIGSGKARFAVAPMPTEGGAGVSFTLVAAQ